MISNFIRTMACFHYLNHLYAWYTALLKSVSWPYQSQQAAGYSFKTLMIHWLIHGAWETWLPHLTSYGWYGQWRLFYFWDCDPVFKTSQQITRIHGCVLERVWENVPTRVLASAHIGPGYNMTAQRNKVCGVDIHKKFLIATILTRDVTKLQKRFETDIDNLLNFSTCLAG
jgi:hypothetical protein